MNPTHIRLLPLWTRASVVAAVCGAIAVVLLLTGRLMAGAVLAGAALLAALVALVTRSRFRRHPGEQDGGAPDRPVVADGPSA